MFFFFGPLFFIVPVLVLLVASRFLSGLFRHAMRDSLPPDAGGRTLRGAIGFGGTPVLESRVFSLAYRMGGRVTVSDVVIDSGLGIKDAEALLDGMTDELRVRMVLDERGLVAYEFPEIMERLRRERG
jgi:hypothetical protein